MKKIYVAAIIAAIISIHSQAMNNRPNAKTRSTIVKKRKRQQQNKPVKLVKLSSGIHDTHPIVNNIVFADCPTLKEYHAEIKSLKLSNKKSDHEAVESINKMIDIELIRILYGRQMAIEPGTWLNTCFPF